MDSTDIAKIEMLKRLIIGQALAVFRDPNATGTIDVITYSVDEDGQPLDFNAGSAYLAGGYVAQLIVYGPHNIPWRQLSPGECRATIVLAMEALYQQLNNDMSRMIKRMVDAKSLRHAEQADAVWGLHNA